MLSYPSNENEIRNYSYEDVYNMEDDYDWWEEFCSPSYDPSWESDPEWEY